MHFAHVLSSVNDLNAGTNIKQAMNILAELVFNIFLEQSWEKTTLLPIDV